MHESNARMMPVTAAQPVPRGPRPAPPGGLISRAMWRLRPQAIWAALRGEPAAFWLLNIYYFFEYVRPQSVWESLSVIPWTTPILLLTAAAVPLSGIKLRSPTVLGRLLWLLTALILVSSLTAWSPSISFANLGVWFNWVLVFVLTCSLVTTERRFVIFMVAFFLYNLKMSQHGARGWIGAGFGFVSWGNSGAPGWFQNSGDFGVGMCVFFPLATTFIIGLWKRWSRLQRAAMLILPVTAVMSIIGSSSRGALVGAGAVLAWFVVRSRYRVRAAVMAVIVAATVIFVLPETAKERFHTAGDDYTSQQRITVWKHGLTITSEQPVLGIGYANWSDYNEQRFGNRLMPHNIFIQVMAEEGIPSLIVYLAMILGTFVVNYRTRKLVRKLPGDNGFIYQLAYGFDGALIGYITSGFFVSVFYWPCFWINMAMTAALYGVAQRKARAYAPPRRRPVRPRFGGPPVVFVHPPA